ncbi:MAG: hypothetical protein AB1442_00220 [Nitrospirota bacterium]
MLVGYNTNISFKDKVYHVQTEDSGRNNPVIVTLLYSKGAILASKKTSYTDIAGDRDFEDKVRLIMKEQHKNMIKDLLSGKYAGECRAEEVPEPDSAEPECESQPVQETVPKEERVKERVQATDSLDDILLNYILKRNT